MISAITWVPAGVADPSPKRYELSAAEREVLDMMAERDVKQLEAPAAAPKERQRNENSKHVMEVKLPEADVSALPADLRMDEYSSDEDDAAEATIGGLLVGSGPKDVGGNGHGGQIDDYGHDDDGDDDDGEKDETGDLTGDQADDAEIKDEIDTDSSDDDDDDSLGDAPDNREYMPINVGGLDSMGVYNVGLGTGADMEDMDFEEDDSEAEDVRITDDDAIILVTKTEEDFSALEVHVYDQQSGTMYVHHDIPLPSFPLCLAHGVVNAEGTTGNYCAVGTFGTGIEIWNLDVINALEPACVLGGDDTTMVDEMMKRHVVGEATKGIKPTSLRPGSHTDSVMGLAWNTIHKQVIASASADKTVKIWDVTQAKSSTGSCNAATFTHHNDKVQSVSWHPKEGTLLATGSYDKTVALLDARSNGESVKSVKISADCEVIAWDPFHTEYLTVATEDGTISCWDVRKFQTSSPLWSFSPSEYGDVRDLSYSPHVPGLLATCSIDKTVTLWDAHSNGAPAENVPPRPCGNKDMCAGKLYTIEFYGSTPLLLACGGSGNMLSLWNLEDERAVTENFGNRGQDASARGSPELPVPNQSDLEAMIAERPGQSTTPEKVGHKKKAKKHKKGKRKAHKKGG